MKKLFTLLIALATLMALSASSLESGITYRATDRTWSEFQRYVSTVNGRNDEVALSLYREGKEKTLSALPILTFYPDGTLLVANSNYTNVHVTRYYVSQGRVLITRKDSNMIFGTGYEYSSEGECIHFGFFSSDETSIGLNPHIVENAGYFTLYK